MQGILMIFLMFTIMYFLIIRPQKLRQKELDARIAALKIGDKIVTTAGIHGMITNVKEKTVKVKVDANTKMEFEKSAVASIVPKAEGASKSEEADDDSETNEESA